MKITFLGAVQEVTGSNYLLECGGKRIFVDCGIHQGRDEDGKNREEPAFNPGEVDAALLTHAHIDHSGRVPFLVKRGFKGKIWVTSPTAALLDVLWRDSAHLMMEEAEWKNRKNSRKGLPPVEPLYGIGDVTDAVGLLSPLEYDAPCEILPGVTACFRNAGHILGSASLALDLRESKDRVRVVFSGDLGQRQSVMGRAPDSFREAAHYVLIESTYGDRRHKDLAATRAEFRSVIAQALRDKGKVLIPSFVIDRAQRILYELLLMQREGLIPEDLPVFFDSPMGVKATELYRRYGDTLSDDVRQFIAGGQDPFSPKGLTYVSSPEDSRKINDVPFCIVIAGSGMCSGGRIVHHLKHGLWNPKNHVIFVGYQSYGTLGRRIVDGAANLRIAGEEVALKAKVHTIGGFSAHGDCDDLLAWAQTFENSPLFFVTHGERTASHTLAASLQQTGMRSMVPMKAQEFQLLPEVILKPSPAPVTEFPKAGVAVATENEVAAVALDDLSRLVAVLRAELRDAANIGEVVPLLQAGRTLLETAKLKVGKR
ncbi:MAG: MBL fold metallo-hydrolase [Synergistaceae bacterium]|nr:MBL fold metallo-hydrolase [Synergistaceae bacterium]